MSTIPYAHITQGPAVAQRTVTVAPRRGINPLIPLCCLALILFLIAATIVLALIPVYLNSRGQRVQTQTAPFTVLYRINNGTLPTGQLTSGNCAAIQKDQQNLISLNRGVAPSSPIVNDCAVTGNTTVTRRRRQFQRGEGNLIRIIGNLPGERSCLQGQCLIRRVEIFIALLLGRGTFFLTFAGANGTRFVFSITCISASFLTPVNIGSGTSGSSGASSSSGASGSSGSSAGGGSSTQAAALNNDIAILNYALVLERLEANFYNRFQNNYTQADFSAAGFSNEIYGYFNLIESHENTHVSILTSVISQLGSTPVTDCDYNFDSVTSVASYVAVARVLENTGTMAYTGAANGIADPILREVAATIATVEARHAAYLNLILGISPSPTPFENATNPTVIIQAIQPFIRSCPFTITAPTVAYIGSNSFTGSIPTTNNTSVFPYTNAMYTNDLRALNFALVAEHLESTFYNTFVGNFTNADFALAGFSGATIQSYFIMIRAYEATHVTFIQNTIIQRGGTPVSVCAYNFNVTNVTDFLQLSRTFENTGVKAYDGAINTISDPNIIQSAATIATVEARFASFLNLLLGFIPFPDAFDPTLTPAQVVSVLSAYQTCPFTPDLPVVLTPSTLVLNISNQT